MLNPTQDPVSACIIPLTLNSLTTGVSKEGYPHGNALPEYTCNACTASAKQVILSRAHPNCSKCTVTVVICEYMFTWSLRDVRCLTFILPWSQKHFTMALLKYFKSSLHSAKDSGISELVTCERSLCSCITSTDRETTTERTV